MVLLPNNAVADGYHSGSGEDVEHLRQPTTQPVPHEVVHHHNATSDDEQSGHVCEKDYTGMFEGPEKTLEVVFRRADGTTDYEHQVVGTGDILSPEVGECCRLAPIKRVGLRLLSRNDLDRICARARCTILSVVSNRYLDAYVLSESSLFVYPYMLTLKTCGTTTLLRVIAVLIDLARKVAGLEIDWVGYSRKNFNFPGDQAFPHQSFHQELDYLYSHRSLCERLDGNGYTLGPVTGDHWFVFVADQTMRSNGLEVDTDRVLNIMMFDIDEAVAKLFHYDQYQRNDGETKEEETERISREQTVVSGINSLCPGALIDPRAFEPCGYSMNAILFRSYSTIHITPESGSSYASFETNQKVGSYKALISNVIRTFRPKRFVLTFMADEGAMHQVKENPLTDSAANARIEVPQTAMPINTKASFSSSSSAKQQPLSPVEPPENLVNKQVVNTGGSGSGSHGSSVYYKRSSTASIKVEDDCCCLMGNWVLEKTPKQVRAAKTRGMTIG